MEKKKEGIANNSSILENPFNLTIKKKVKEEKQEIIQRLNKIN